MDKDTENQGQQTYPKSKKQMHRQSQDYDPRTELLHHLHSYKRFPRDKILLSWKGKYGSRGKSYNF